MKRSTVIGDRLITFIIAAALICLATFSICWWQGFLIDVPDKLSASWTRTVDNESWYPWAVGGAGALLCLLGIRSFSAHLRNHKVSELRVASDVENASLKLNVGAALSAASEALAASLGIRSVNAIATHEGSGMVCSFSVRIDPEAELAEVAADCNRVIADLENCIGRNDLKCRAVITATSRSRPKARAG